MKINHNIGNLNLAVYVRVTNWDKDDDGHPVIGDVEFDQIEIIFCGETFLPEDDLEQGLLEALEKDTKFWEKVETESFQEGEEALLEKAIARAEAARDMLDERERGN